MAEKPGPTGEFPEGKLDESDEGELKFLIGHANGNVLLDFGKPVKWLAMPPGNARAIAEALLVHADKAEGEGA